MTFSSASFQIAPRSILATASTLSGGSVVDVVLGGRFPDIIARPATPDYVCGVGAALGNQLLPFSDGFGTHAVAVPDGIYNASTLAAAINAQLMPYQAPFDIACQDGAVRISIGFGVQLLFGSQPQGSIGGLVGFVDDFPSGGLS
eukprot:CAMPEP_0113690948 /NCGR_PEP_ID=MMETSP0038_2-20120614/18119_1 /TAXON_ID=2898 /ORGANISM="Cryptomonas paramecium" /LENGTH=144 /DNA_ID=CAMNT_0000612419 /DNA_START=438 /DNA_END=868 /DNA_ORIENTATION=+ /assembly_acc=CAM_ASM_000170